MDVIDRKAVLEALDELDSHQTMSRYQCSKDLANTRLGISIAVDLVEAMPTVDAVPVVRCINCKYWTMVHDYDYGKNGKGTLGRCMRSGWWYKPDHYCSQGDRGEGE